MFISKDQYSTSPLLSLPSELVEPIAADIYSPTDLPSPPCTCKALYGIIVPFHLHFRKINLNLNTAPLALWYKIIIKPRPMNKVLFIIPYWSRKEEYISQGPEPFRKYAMSSRSTGRVKLNYTAPQWITTSQILWTLSTSCPLIQEVTLCPEEAM
ncbi:hypothetical protein M422DRAFT_256345 [Sphaerobolus stellatus SS14]|uniref:F-box domain-containing protein n=1 Tax=Sphaerobolus stellatus (strain SS14) TaxID=990650 RepID=A0A0C9UC07_SPHS4|nr:hypothetical protein M422DRAFT_256345 [Sphaerobolus stellatus SS14]